MSRRLTVKGNAPMIMATTDTGIGSISSLEEPSSKPLQHALTDRSYASAGPFTLPNFPLFSKLLRYAYRQPCPLAVRDDVSKIERTYLHLLTDVLSLRNGLRRTLPAHVRRQLDNQEEVYICVLAPGGYEFVVAYLAVLALGAAAVPLCKAYNNIAKYIISEDRICRPLTDLFSYVFASSRGILLRPKVPCRCFDLLLKQPRPR